MQAQKDGIKMKAMILAAGIGSRLKPYTDYKPKALIELYGKTLLQIQLEKLKKTGITEVVVNVHHFADQIISYLEENKNFGMHIEISDESSRLLDTGGALKKAAAFFGSHENILLQNVDVVSDIQYRDMYNFHLQHEHMVSLAVSGRKTSRYLLFDNENNLCGWTNRKKDETILVSGKSRENLQAFAFSGIHMINTDIFKSFEDNDAFSIIPFYLSAAEKFPIKAYKHAAEYWWDIGKAADFAALQKNTDIEKIINQ